MRVHIVILSTWALILACWVSMAHGHNANKMAYAIPLEGITIDGELDDWPDTMAVYPIGWVHPSAYKPMPPEGPEDLSASFRVGYDKEQGVLYVAVVVRDEDLVVHPDNPGWVIKDACEIYIDGDHSGSDNASAATGAQQYVMVPGAGRFNASADANPALADGETAQSGVQAAFLRLGDVTVYEWAIPLFERYPDRRLTVKWGQSIGFDVAVADADGEELANWVAWTPKGGKVWDSNLFGDLTFVEDYGELEVTLGPVAPVDYENVAVITGRVTEWDGVTPIRGARVELLQEGRPLLSVSADSTGTYRQAVLKGTYTVRAEARGMRAPAIREEVTIPGGGEVRMDLELEDLGTIFYVDDDADTSGTGTREHPFNTVRAGINATSEGDTVFVFPGTYWENLSLPDGVTLLGSGADGTILDGRGEDTVVRIEGSDVMVSGFTITNGRGSSRGLPGEVEYREPVGGVSIENRRTRVTVRDNVISRNTTDSFGAGMGCFQGDSTVVIEYNLIVDNRVRLREGFRQSRQASHWTDIGGGSIVVEGGDPARGNPAIRNNTIVYNTREGGIANIVLVPPPWPASSARIYNNIIAYNGGSGLYYRTRGQAVTHPEIAYNDVYSNGEYDYAGLEVGEEDLSLDPRFVDPEGGDFRLREDSPCRGRGMPRGTDMGAYTRDSELLKRGVRSPRLNKDMVAEWSAKRVPEGAPRMKRIAYETVQLQDAGALLPKGETFEVQRVQVVPEPYDLKRDKRQVTLYTTSNGLVSNAVGKIVEAPDGALWFATDRGLSRYDGLWTVLDTSNGLPANDIRDVVVDDNGTVWIATDKGMCRYDSAGVQVIAGERMWNMGSDSEGNLWIGEPSTELSRYDGMWTYYTIADSIGQQRSVDVIFLLEAQNGDLWFAEYSGSILIKYDGRSWVRYSMPEDTTAGTAAWRGDQAFEDGRGNLWLTRQRWVQEGDTGYEVTQIVRFDGRTWTVYGLPDDEGRDLSIGSILQDRDGAIWFCSEGKALRYDGTRWTWVELEEAMSRVGMVDREGNIWFGSTNGAVRYGMRMWTSYTSSMDGLKGTSVNALAQDADGALWFGTESGANRYRPDAGTWDYFAIRDGLPDSSITCLLVDSRGEIWAGTRKGIGRYRRGRWNAYATAEGLADSVVTCLLEDEKGNIWAGTGKGVSRYDGKRWTRIKLVEGMLGEDIEVSAIFEDRQGRIWFATPIGIYQYNGEVVKDYLAIFYPDRWFDLTEIASAGDAGQIKARLRERVRDEVQAGWLVGSLQPDMRYAPPSMFGVPLAREAWSRVLDAYTSLIKESEFKALIRRAMDRGDVQNPWTLRERGSDPEWLALGAIGRGGGVTAICEDQEGGLRFYIYNEILRYHEGTWTRYDEREGLAGSLICKASRANMLQDSRGNMWVPTYAGLSRATGTEWVTYTVSDGLVDSRVLAILEDQEGDMWFGTLKGISRYRRDRTPPNTRIVGGPEGTVSHRTASVMFAYEGGDRETGAWDLSYSYALRKGDGMPGPEEWSAYGSRRFSEEIPLSGHGRYTFYVRARDKEGNEDPTPEVQSFYVEPPIWRRVWFQGLAGISLLLVGVSSGYGVQRNRRWKRAQAQLIEETEHRSRVLEEANRQIQKANQAKSEFLANMSHELRTPMNSVLGFTEMILDGIYGEVPGDIEGAMREIDRSGRLLLDLINDVLDLSKIEAGEMELHRSECDVELCVGEAISSVEVLAQRKGLAMVREVEEELPCFMADEMRIGQVLRNLLSNAVKFTQEGEIAVGARGAEGEMVFWVRDTGIGIPEGELESIFSEFHQVDSSLTKQQQGTGLGLSLCRRLVEMHGGRVWVESEEGKGSTFWFSVPQQEGGASQGTPME